MPFFHNHNQLEQLGKEILETTWSRFPTLARNQIAMTWIVYDDPVIVNTGGALSHEEFWQYPLRGFSYRGLEVMPSGDLVNLFYVVALYEWLDKEMAQPSTELDRAIHDAIVYSNNDAASLIIDILTGTTSGPELSPGPFETWKAQRNIINRYYEALGWEELQGCNINQKTWLYGPYGREKQFFGEYLEHRNRLTTNGVARLLHSIIGGVAVSSECSKKIMNLLRGKIRGETIYKRCDRITGFLGDNLPNNALFWSKTGWLPTVRHDAAYIEVENLQPYLLVVFLEGEPNSFNNEILPDISQRVLEVMNRI